MTVTDQIKILDRKIKQNEAQYDLDREAAKISAMSSNNLDKYEYLTGEDLGLKPSTVEQAKFEYSPLGKIFNKGLSEEDKKEGILKRLENIKDKNDELLNTFNTTNKINKTPKINNQSKILIYSTQYSFAKFRNIDDIKELSLDSMHKKLSDFHKKFTRFKVVAPRTKDKKILKNKVLSNARNLYNDLYYIYKDKYNKEINSLNTENIKKLDYKKLRLTDDYQYSSEEEQKETKTDMNKYSKYIAKEETDINEELFMKHFYFQRPSDMLKNLNQINDIEKNNKLVDAIITGLKDLKEKIKEMPEEGKENEKPDKILKIVREILQFNKEKQQGQGIKILTPSQKLSRLPISLAQLEAGNNSEKLKNEVRQLLYSLYRSKNITKQVYNNLMKPI